MSGSAAQQKTLEIAQRVVGIASDLGIDLVLIGAVALAVHRYVRATVDLDLASAVDPSTALQKLTDALRAEGLDAELNLPDAQDPLGGVLNINGADFNRIQIVNFVNPWNGLAPVGRESVATAVAMEGEPFKVVDLPHLIALKLYAGGNKSKTDVIELLEHNQDADLAEIRRVCARFGLGQALETLLSDLELA
jgi:hypothetical protein